MKIYDNILELIGKTPLLELKKINEGGFGRVFVKLESKNPGGSVKDRPALRMIEDAEKVGKINKDTIIIEPTSGNTGIGLALVCAVKGYKLVLVMPESMSVERRKILKAYGAELVLTPAAEGMKGSVERAETLLKENENSIIIGQFYNPSNPLAHELTTAKEIIDDLDEVPDVFVASFGTGGTVSGCAKVFRAEKKYVKIYAVEPESSPLVSKGQAGAHKIQGIGANFVPENFKRELVDEVLTCSNELAFETSRNLAKKEGILCGISAGANVAKALELAKLPENKDKKIVTIICDTGERYLSGELFE
ncbi:cysteine synthase A [bacterium]|nr:cysteine synthase A [bacterium]